MRNQFTCYCLHRQLLATAEADDRRAAPCAASSVTLRCD